MRSFHFLALLSTLTKTTKAGLEPCETANVRNDICSLSEGYQAIDPPQEPVISSLAVNIREVVGIDEQKQRMKIMLDFYLWWGEPRVSKTNQTDDSVPFDITHQLKNLWIPEVYFSNAIQVDKLRKRTLWYQYDKHPKVTRSPGHQFGTLRYENVPMINVVDSVTVEFVCHMSFNAFPFDHHFCSLAIRPSTLTTKYFDSETCRCSRGFRRDQGYT